ncbi:MAG TPA: hypothetical protein VHA12_03435 [Candidatus Nanoarchaeia archaeon]|nr:hypothetical protein [Candidatus Nanoarchaeia archaeon]
MKNKTIQKAKNLLLAGALLTGALTTEVAAGVSGNVEHIQSTEAGQSYERLNAFYSLPADVKGYTFLEAYHDGTAFGKTTLTRKLSDSISVVSQTRSINEGFTDTGIGLQLNIPVKNGYALVRLVPAWLNSEGKSVRSRNILGFAVGKNLSDKVSAAVFAELNLNSKSGAEWAYGEAQVFYSPSKDWNIGYNPALRNKSAGSIVPRVEHRFAVQRKF